MILVIWPLGKEPKDIRNWLVRLFMYTAASTLGAATLALLLGLAGRGLYLLFPTIALEWLVGLLGAVSILYALHELNIIRLPNPQKGWLVPKSWQRWGRLVGNTLYGYVLGMGIFTYIPFGSFYLLLMWELVVGMFSIKAAVLLGVIYGFSRGLPAILGGISMLRDQYPLPVTNWLTVRLGLWHAINGVVLMLIGGFLLGTLIL
jgi:hypothetical protein